MKDKTINKKVKKFQYDFDWKSECLDIDKKLQEEKNKFKAFKEETKHNAEENWKDGFRFGEKTTIKELIDKLNLRLGIENGK